MAKLFDKGDEEFFQWMIDNPHGFILNTKKGVVDTYFVLHKSNCSHVTKYSSLDDKAYTMRSYVKVASNDVYDIFEYCIKNKKNFKGNFRDCKSCRPTYDTNSNLDIIEFVYPDELSDFDSKRMEGAKKIVTVNAYERDINARKDCIKQFGYKCQCCGLLFSDNYGEIGDDFIHVHHKVQLSTIGHEYVVDPIMDLIPVCPNCHAMLHKRKPIPYTIEELKEKLKIK